jgi:hypothetical protein
MENGDKIDNIYYISQGTAYFQNSLKKIYFFMLFFYLYSLGQANSHLTCSHEKLLKLICNILSSFILVLWDWIFPKSCVYLIFLGFENKISVD